jgi:hypothetical protein
MDRQEYEEFFIDASLDWWEKEVTVAPRRWNRHRASDVPLESADNRQVDGPQGFMRDNSSNKDGLAQPRSLLHRQALAIARKCVSAECEGDPEKNVMRVHVAPNVRHERQPEAREACWSVSARSKG